MFTLKNIVQSTIIEFYTESDGDVKFRLEISQLNDNEFYIDLYKATSYSVKPSGEKDNVIADEIIWVDYGYILSFEDAFSSIESCFEHTLNALKTHYCLK